MSFFVNVILFYNEKKLFLAKVITLASGPLYKAATGCVLSKKVFLRISQNSQEHPSVGLSLLIKLQTLGLQLYWKRDFKPGVFSRTHFFTEQCQWLLLFCASVLLISLFFFQFIFCFFFSWSFHIILKRNIHAIFISCKMLLVCSFWLRHEIS